MATFHFGEKGPGFSARHIGPNESEIKTMLGAVAKGRFKKIDDLIDKVVPEGIRLQSELTMSEALSEHEALAKMQGLARQNKVFKS